MKAPASSCSLCEGSCQHSVGLPAILKAKGLRAEGFYKVHDFAANCSHEGLLECLDKQRSSMQSAS